jgi:hypothetical protein
MGRSRFHATVRRPPTSWRWVCISATIVVVLFGGSEARAIPIKLSDKDATFSARLPDGDECVNIKTGLSGPHYVNCTNIAILNLNDGAALRLSATGFRTSFDEWNSTNPADGKWTLVDGGALPGGELDVFRFFTFVTRTGTVGGVDIKVSWEYDGADKADFKWTQGIIDNYERDGTIKPPVFEMDVKATGCDNTDLEKQCPPLYPLQFDDRRFEDTPRAPWPNGFFTGAAYLSKADFTKRELTVYEGLEYDFTLFAELVVVPQPATLILIFAGLLTLRAVARRGRRRSRLDRMWKKVPAKTRGYPWARS